MEHICETQGIPNPEGLLPPKSFTYAKQSTTRQRINFRMQQIESWNDEVVDRMCWNCLMLDKRAVPAPHLRVVGFWGVTVCESCSPLF